MQKLFASIRDSLWEQRIFVDLMDLLIKTAQFMPKFKVPQPVLGLPGITNETMAQLSLNASNAYIVDEDYHAALEILRGLIGVIGLIPQYDRLILDYAKGIAAKYEILLSNYESAIDKQIEEKAGEIFAENNLKTWRAAKNAAAIYEKLRVFGRKSNAITKKKTLWYKLIKQYQGELEFTLYSGKK
jgi:hypothetical protein